ncbi:hypothetical protein J6590_002519 [Homalodisca vitripennis]|nr:hypothetical protein J6590_002519 [Homalodisca vitripennis]
MPRAVLLRPIPGSNQDTLLPYSYCQEHKGRADSCNVGGVPTLRSLTYTGNTKPRVLHLHCLPCTLARPAPPCLLVLPLQYVLTVEGPRQAGSSWGRWPSGALSARARALDIPSQTSERSCCEPRDTVQWGAVLSTDMGGSRGPTPPLETSTDSHSYSPPTKDTLRTLNPFHRAVLTACVDWNTFFIAFLKTRDRDSSYRELIRHHKVTKLMDESVSHIFVSTVDVALDFLKLLFCIRFRNWIVCEVERSNSLQNGSSREAVTTANAETNEEASLISVVVQGISDPMIYEMAVPGKRCLLRFHSLMRKGGNAQETVMTAVTDTNEDATLMGVVMQGMSDPIICELAVPGKR